jgi:peptidyl-prolyl cis-trans isomerase SurA
VAAALVLAGCSGARQASTVSAPDGSPLVASWDGATLSLNEFEQTFTATDGAATTASDDPLERRLDFLNRYVNFRLKVRSARDAGYHLDSAYAAEVAEYRDQLAGPHFMDRQVLDDIIRDIYDKQAEEIAVSHLLRLVGPYAPPADTLAAYQHAVAVRDSIRSGAVTFTEAARRHSEDPSVSANGGALGYITGGMTVIGFEDAVYRTAVGEVAGPVRTQYGYHIIEVTDRREPSPEIKASHILLRPDGTTPADTAATVQQAEALRAREMAGESFGTLARQYSQDPGSAQRDGDLGYFSTGRMVAPFEQAAFALANVGDISGPVQTRFGIHLIQLTDRRARETFEEAYEELKSTAMQLPRTALKRRALGREFREQNGGSFDAATVRLALAHFPSDSVFQKVVTGGFRPEDAGRTFATVGDSTYTLAALPSFYRRARIGANPVDELVALAQDFIDDRSVDQAVARLEERDPEFARIFRSYADGVLYFRAAEDSVWTPAKDDEAGLRAFYAANQGAYNWPTRRRVLAFRTPGDSLLRAIAEDLRGGADARALFEQHRGGRFALRLDTVYVSDSTQTALDQTLGLEVGQSTGVLAERTRLAVYVLDGIEPPRPKRYEEARAELISGYQEQIERAWEARLRARYQARLYPERVTVPSSILPPGPRRPSADQ